MRNIKNIVALILTIALCLGMVACGKDNASENTSSDVATVTEAEISTATDVAQATTEDKSVTEEKTTEKKTTEKKTTEEKTTEKKTTEEKTTEKKTTEEKTTEEKKTTEAKKTETTQAPTTEAPRTTEAPKTTQAPTTEAPHETGTSVVAATCESGGYTVHYMSDGSSYMTDQTAALGHNWEEYGHTETVKEYADVEYLVCRLCGFKGRRSDPATVHHWDTCDGTSYNTFVQEEVGSHVEYITDGYRCSRCGATK